MRNGVKSKDNARFGLRSVSAPPIMRSGIKSQFLKKFPLTKNVTQLNKFRNVCSKKGGEGCLW